MSNGEEVAMVDRISKQKLNVIIMVDASTSMRGERIRQVNNAIRDIKKHLTELESENSTVDFYLTVITFSTEAKFLGNDKEKKVDDFAFQDISAGGRSNLHLAYEALETLLKKEKHGGIMPDFGGTAPILLLLTDGHPTEKCREQLARLKELPWFRVALRYGIAIGLNDKRTIDCLHAFVSENGDVIECYDFTLLGKIIKIIVMTASKVKSSSASVHSGEAPCINREVRQEIQEALGEAEDWEW